MAIIHRLKIGRIIFLFLVIFIVSGFWIIQNYFVTEITKYKKEHFDVTKKIREKATYSIDFLNTPHPRSINFYKKGDSFFSNKVYYIELKSRIRNTGSVVAVYQVYNWIETIQEGYLDGNTHNIELAPNESYELYARIDLPSGKNTKFPNRGFYGCEVKAPIVEVIKTITNCRWVPYVETCISLLPDCTDQKIANLSGDCNLPQSKSITACTITQDDLPLKGIINTKKTGLNLRRKAAKSMKDLSDEDIVVMMEKSAMVKIVDISQEKAEINEMKGKWLTLIYIDEQGVQYSGFAWCKNIRLIPDNKPDL